MDKAGEGQPWLGIDKAESCTLISFSSENMEQCGCMSLFLCCCYTSLGCGAKLKSKVNKYKCTTLWALSLLHHNLNVALQTS